MLSFRNGMDLGNIYLIRGARKNMQKPFRFGIVSGGVKPRATLFEKVRRAEELGYASLVHGRSRLWE